MNFSWRNEFGGGFAGDLAEGFVVDDHTRHFVDVDFGGAAVGGAHVGDDALEMLDEPRVHVVVKCAQRTLQHGVLRDDVASACPRGTSRR